MGRYIYATSKNICEQKTLLATGSNYQIYIDIFTIPLLKYLPALTVISDTDPQSTSIRKMKQ